MGEQTPPAAVNVARLRAADRPAVVDTFVDQMVDVTVRTAHDQSGSYRGAAIAVAAVFGEPGAYVLLLVTDGGRVLAIKLSRLLTVAPAGADPQRAG